MIFNQKKKIKDFCITIIVNKDFILIKTNLKNTINIKK